MSSSAEETLVKHHRFELLDAMRGIGALAVATIHGPPDMRRFVSFPNAFLAVDLFFCLSGFVIGFAYEGRLAGGMKLKQFVVARLVRLYPLYFLGMVLGVLVIVGRNHFMPPAERVGAALLPALSFGLLMLPTMVGKAFSDTAFPVNVPSWSLFFEMFINIGFAVMVLRRWASSAVLLIGTLLSLGITFYYVVLPHGTLSVGYLRDSSFLLAFPRVTSSFFVGVLLFRLSKRRPGLVQSPAWNGLVGVLVMMALAFALLASFKFTSSTLYQFCVAVLLMPLLVFAAARVRVAPRWKRICLLLGEFSYPLYILHMPLFLPLYWAHKLHLGATLYQLITPAAIVAMAFLTRWIAIHYDAPVRRFLNGKIEVLGTARAVAPL